MGKLWNWIMAALVEVADLPTSPPIPDIILPPGDLISEDGELFAGRHLFLDLWGATCLTSADVIERTLRKAACDAGATVLHSHFHTFGGGGGISGVIVLAESHISIHTWPERKYAAIDVFMCGTALPKATIPAIKNRFKPEVMHILESRRGNQAVEKWLRSKK